MAETYNGGITVTFPSAGEVNWTAVFREFARTLSDHDHTGGGRGTKISGSAIELDAFTGEAFRLNYNQWLRSRNDLNTADVNMIRITGDNVMEIAPVTFCSVMYLDFLRVNAVGGGPLRAIIQNNLDDGIALDLIAGIGKLGFQLDANVTTGDAIYTNYANQGALVFQERVNALGEKTFAPGGIDKYRMTNVAFVPTSDDAFDLGAVSFRFANAFITSLNTSAINATGSFVVKIDGATYWTVNAAGSLIPGSNETQDIGSLGVNIRRVYATEIFGNNHVNIGVNGVPFVQVDSSGSILPSFTTQDLGAPATRWRSAYFSTAINVPSISATTLSISGALSSGSLSTGTINCSSVTATGAISAGANITGSAHFSIPGVATVGSILNVTGPITCTTLSASTSITTPSILGPTWTSFTPALSLSTGGLSGTSILKAIYMVMGKKVSVIIDALFNVPAPTGVGAYLTIGNFLVPSADLLGCAVGGIGGQSTLHTAGAPVLFIWASSISLVGMCAVGGSGTVTQRVVLSFTYQSA